MALAVALASAGACAAAADVDDPRQVARHLLLDRDAANRATVLPGARLLASVGSTRLVVGLHNEAQLARIGARLRALGANVEPLPALTALAVRDLSAASVIQLLRGDPAVAFIEEDRELSRFADPFDTIDAETGLNYQWAYDAVAAGAGIAAVGGGSPFLVAVIDSGIEVTHPDLAGRIAGSYSALDGSTVVTDEVGHGTFVAGLISAIDGNGIGGKGAAGATNLLAVKASTPGGEFYESQLADSIVWSTDAGARVINMSLGGPCPTGELIASALDYAFERNVLLVAAAGNNAEFGNAPNCPAADLGGLQGDWGRGLSVGATTPAGLRAPFSTFNDNISVAAPGGGNGDCRYGVFSTLPSTPSLWDGSCSAIFSPPEGAPARWAYGEGTSFAAPLASAVAALALSANPNLLPEQAAEVLKRSAQQTVGEGWNQQTGFGIVNAAAAVDLAHRFDTLEPSVEIAVVPGPRSLKIVLDATDAGRDGEEAANGTTFTVERSRDGSNFEPWVPERGDRLVRTLKGSRNGPAHWFRAIVCDANHNCATKTVGPKRPVLVKPRVKLRVKELTDGRHRATVALKRVKGLRGRARVILERRVDKKFRSIGNVKVGFGKSARRTFRVADGETVQLRARVMQAPDWRAVRSRAISVAAATS